MNEQKLEKGNVIGRWLLINNSIDNGRSKWLCMCKCGTLRLVEAHKLRNGKSQSCGCKAREDSKIRNAEHWELFNLYKQMIANLLDQLDSKINPAREA